MKKTILSVGKIVTIYLLSIIILNGICAYVLSLFYNNSYSEMIIFLLCNSNQVDGQKNLLFNLVIAFKNLISGVALAILASIIFTFILNREIKIFFPDKIVLRRRTSEGSEGRLTIGILIGNPGRRLLWDVNCNIHCVYVKQIGEIEQQNAEIYLNQTIEFVKNYFRFSFEIENLPKIFWKHYLERHEDYVEKDFLVVTITGKTDGLGGYFRVSKKYYIQDIIVDTRTPEMYFKQEKKIILHPIKRP